MTRVHFLGRIPYARYIRLLQVSSAHVYLTVPFVLSWSVLEAMSAGCVVIGSSTAPVREVLQDGKNGLLVDFFSPREVAERVDEVFAHRDRMQSIRISARQSVIERFAVTQSIQAYRHVIQTVVGWSIGANAPADPIARRLTDERAEGLAA